MKVVIKRLASEGFPGCCLQLADHTQRGMKEKAEEKDLKSCSFLLNPLFSLPVCLRLSLKGLRVDMLAYPQLPHTRPSFGGIYHLPTLRVLPSPPLPPFPVIVASILGSACFSLYTQQRKSAGSPSALRAHSCFIALADLFCKSMQHIPHEFLAR